MKKFLDKKVADYKFRRAGQGHRLDEERARPQPTKTQPGRGGGRGGVGATYIVYTRALIASLKCLFLVPA